MNKVQTFDGSYEMPSFNTKWFKPISNEEYASKNKNNTISGKTSNIWKDIVKRFFKNYWNIVFLTILLFVVGFLIFGGLFVQYSDSSNVSSSLNIDLMRPSWARAPIRASGTVKELQLIISNNLIYDAAKDTILIPGSSDIIQSAKWDPANTIWNVTYFKPNYVPTILGTDSSGISVYSRLVTSSRFSIGLAVLVATTESAIGTIAGLYLGFNAGKRLDTYFMRVIEIFSIIPALLWITILILIFGNGFSGMFISLIMIGWVTPVYVARMFTIKIKDAEFIKASQSIGASQNKIIFKHVLPNILGRVLVSFVYRIPSVIFIESTLIFLGIQLGGEMNNTLGSLLYEGRKIGPLQNNPYLLASATSVLLLFTLSIQILANGLRDAFDAKVSS
ncbi:MAG: ABC transporter permease [Mycoplasmatales bacterium]|nr:ABC transporter permease [Mycoplasmatales bacterium]